MTILNLMLALLAVAAVTGVALMGFVVGNEPQTAGLIDEPERDSTLELAA